MSRRMIWMLFAIVLGFASAPLCPAAVYGVGGCNPKIKNYSTIQSAVSSVPVGATIQVCPGTYFEQVTIVSPLTLEAATYSNSNRVVVKLPPNDNIAYNVTSLLGMNVYAQILVANLAPIGPVNITGITIDGSGGNVNCGAALAGIFYASGTMGTVNEVTTRNQQRCNFGYGIWAENGLGPSETITIENSSVENTDDNGIIADSNQNPSTLTSYIEGNFVNLKSSNSYTPIGIQGAVLDGSISNNFVTGGNVGIQVSGTPAQPNCCATLISDNTIADLPAAPPSIGIFLTNGANAGSQNRIANAYLAFDAPGTATILTSLVAHVTYAAWLDCAGHATVNKNFFMDAQYGFANSPELVTGNNNFNIDTLFTIPCS